MRPNLICSCEDNVIAEAFGISEFIFIQLVSFLCRVDRRRVPISADTWT